MYNPTPNARFWVFGADADAGPCKITLRPGQSLTHETHSRHEEGWSSSSTTWRHEPADAIDGTPARITRESYDDGTDCDGRHSSDHEEHATLDQLAASSNEYLAEQYPGVPFPEWSEGNHSQRDYAAEAAGY